jgi:hypothetical protein
VNSVVNSGKIPEVSKCKLMGFSRWSENASFRDHPSIVQVKILVKLSDQSETTRRI